mmetsp:Transcript_24980/g.47255  ORF Transcript_24980/g.47255 Transcript_24980/m.47255 type:complete len:198 (+) Transcript_24980:154-747(+)
MPAISKPVLSETWVFGYGSLVWRCGFEHVDKRQCYIKDYARVWTQGSTDHRGTPERPGRTVTLEPRKGAKTWGRAYKLPKEKEADIIEYLEEREKQYDQRLVTDLFDVTDDKTKERVVVKDALVYIATSASNNYLGDASLNALASQIALAQGPSGPNCEYLFRLADAVRELGVVDTELFDLEAKVQALRLEGYSVEV